MAPAGQHWSLDEAVLREDIHNNLDRYREAATALSYQCRDAAGQASCHLRDGGLADNTAPATSSTSSDMATVAAASPSASSAGASTGWWW